MRSRITIQVRFDFRISSVKYIQGEFLSIEQSEVVNFQIAFFFSMIGPMNIGLQKTWLPSVEFDFGALNLFSFDAPSLVLFCYTEIGQPTTGDSIVHEVRAMRHVASISLFEKSALSQSRWRYRKVLTR